MKPPRNITGYNPTRDADGFRWDAEAASRAVDFFPMMLTHSKAHSGAFNLEPWQRDVIATLFGWKRPNGTRRYREALIAVPRKNGKTHLGAGLALYLLLCDGEPGAEVYSAAYTREQASLCFEPAASMVRHNPILSKRARIIDSQKRIINLSTASKYVAIPAEAAATHGYSPHAVIFDELHTQGDRDLYDVLKTGMGARSQPLFLSITTAGHDRHSICWEVWDYARQVRDGIIIDPHFLPVIYELADGEAWDDRQVWRRVNPNYGVSISEEFLEEEFSRASATPAYENTFRNLYLNQWTQQSVRWLSMERWDACHHDLPESWYEGRPCWCGLDLSTVQDLSAFVMAFPADFGYALKAYFWLPEDTMREREKRDRVPYGQWVKEGWITTMPGSRIENDRIRADLRALRQRYDIREIAFDPWNSEEMRQKMQLEDGFLVVEHRQGMRSMSPPTKEFSALVAAGQLDHGNNPVMRWCANNVAVYVDAAENMKPDKGKSTERIDGIVAAVMAVGRAVLQDGGSAYDRPTGMYAADFTEEAATQEPAERELLDPWAGYEDPFYA